MFAPKTVCNWVSSGKLVIITPFVWMCYVKVALVYAELLCVPLAGVRANNPRLRSGLFPICGCNAKRINRFAVEAVDLDL
jgi:hypothetical protein